MADIASVTNLKKEIKNILKGADLKTLSAKAVRKTLEDVLKTDLTDRKKEIDDMLMEMITQNSSQDNSQNSTGEESEVKSEPEESDQEVSDEDSDQESPPPKKKSRSNAKPKKQKKAASDDALSGSESDNDGKNSDEALAKRLQEEESSLPRRSAFIKASTKKKSSKKSTEPKEKKKGSNSVYSRPCTLSADLAEVVGANEMPRHSVVKRMWEIARERNLFDPTNKRFIICDDQLYKMFGTKRILMFGIMKHLKTHIKDQKDLAK